MNRTPYYTNYYQTHQESLKAKRRERYAHSKTIQQKQVEQPSPPPVEQIPRLWVEQFSKYVFYTCPDPCWQGKSCSNCWTLTK